MLPAGGFVALAVSMLAPSAEAQRPYTFHLAPGKIEKRAEPLGHGVLPKRTKRVGPVYPDGLASVIGVVHLQVSVDPSGRVAETRPLQFMTLGATQKEDLQTLAKRFAASAVAAVSGWEYEPAPKPMTFMMSILVRPGSGDKNDESSLDVYLPQTHALKRTRQVDPVYPPVALFNGIQGVVIVEATVAPHGQILDARVVRPIPFLDRAALDAVVQWDFAQYEMTPGRVVVTQLWLNFAVK